jgi:hypothetical protein
MDQEGQQLSLPETRRRGTKLPRPEFIWLRFLTGKKGEEGGGRRGNMSRGGRRGGEEGGGMGVEVRWRGSSRHCS